VLDEEEVKKKNVEDQNAEYLCTQSVPRVGRFLEGVQHEAFVPVGLVPQLRTAQFTTALGILIFHFLLDLRIRIRLLILLARFLHIVIEFLKSALPASLLLLLLLKLLLVEFDLFGDLVTDLYLLLEVFEHAALVEEDLEGGFEAYVVLRSGGDVDPALGEDGIFSVHQFVHEHSQRVGIVGVGLLAGVPFEVAMVEIRDFCFILELVFEFSVHGHGLANFGNAVFDVNVFDVEHAETLDGGVLDDLKGLEEGVEEEFDLLLLQSHRVCFEPVYVAEETAVVAVLCNDVGTALLVVGVDNPREGALCLIQV
jgi:hypothetical protein